jgi:hypothetical protein
MSSLHWGHGSRVFIFPMMEHRANQIAAASEAHVEYNALLANSKAKFAKSKVSSLLLSRFRNSQKINLAISLFSIFRSGECGPLPPGRASGGSADRKIICGSHSDSLRDRPQQPCTYAPFTTNLPSCT